MRHQKLIDEYYLPQEEVIVQMYETYENNAPVYTTYVTDADGNEYDELDYYNILNWANAAGVQLCR